MPIFFRSGELENDEFGDLLEGLGVVTTYQQKEDMINELDVDGSGTIDFEEFSTMMRGFQPDRTKERLDTWRMFVPDKDLPPGEGSFDRETFGQALCIPNPNPIDVRLHSLPIADLRGFQRSCEAVGSKLRVGRSARCLSSVIRMR